MSEIHTVVRNQKNVKLKTSLSPHPPRFFKCRCLIIRTLTDQCLIVYKCLENHKWNDDIVVNRICEKEYKYFNKNNLVIGSKKIIKIFTCCTYSKIYSYIMSFIKLLIRNYYESDTWIDFYNNLFIIKKFNH